MMGLSLTFCISMLESVGSHLFNGEVSSGAGPRLD